MYMRTIVFLLFILMPLVALAKEPYKIGAILSVTGAASFLGEPEKNTLLMLSEQINRAGGFNGVPLEIIIEDSNYEGRFRSEPGTFGGHAYDALMMLTEAIKKVGPDKAKIRDYLENNIKNWSGTGGIFNMSPTDHCGLDKNAFEMVVVRDGDWHIIKQ